MDSLYQPLPDTHAGWRRRTYTPQGDGLVRDKDNSAHFRWAHGILIEVGRVSLCVRRKCNFMMAHTHIGTESQSIHLLIGCRDLHRPSGMCNLTSLGFLPVGHSHHFSEAWILSSGSFACEESNVPIWASSVNHTLSFYSFDHLLVLAEMSIV